MSPLRCSLRVLLELTMVDAKSAHLEELIDYVIVNWKKLSDAKLRVELKESGGSRVRSRSMSRGSLKNVAKDFPDVVGGASSSPSLSRSSASISGTPGSKRKGGSTALRNLFSKKE